MRLTQALLWVLTVVGVLLSAAAIVLSVSVFSQVRHMERESHGVSMELLRNQLADACDRLQRATDEIERMAAKPGETQEAGPDSDGHPIETPAADVPQEGSNARGRESGLNSSPADQRPAEADDWLPIELPKPMFVGIPKNIVSPNLEGSTGETHPRLRVPKGVRNLAKGKPVTASDAEPIIGELAMITDGDKEGTEGSYVEFGPGLQWAQIDLGGECDIFAIVVWHYHSQARVYHDVIVQVSRSAKFSRHVLTVFNNDHDNSAGLGTGRQKEYIETFAGRLIDTRVVVGRYVRLYSNGNTANDMNHLVEVEVYGRTLPVENTSRHDN